MFKESFRYYKSKNPPPDLTNVLDVFNTDRFLTKAKKIEIEPSETCGKIFGLAPKETWQVYELIDHPGLIFIKNPFTSIGQRYWIVRCLHDYSKKPNKSNLDSFNLVPEGKDWWEVCQNNSNKLLIDKLRWVTLGYHHDWETKVYSEESKGEFPLDLGNISRYIADVLKHHSFVAEAAIVNYYHMDSTLSGHTDYSEEDLEAPLISFSFGQTAIFLLGGKTKDEEPSAMFLRSGDIVVMSKESRLCYHGVPKILQIDSRFWDNFDEKASHKGGSKESKETIRMCQEEHLWKPFGDFLGHSRININVRQVLRRGQKRLFTDSEKT